MTNHNELDKVEILRAALTGYDAEISRMQRARARVIEELTAKPAKKQSRHMWTPAMRAAAAERMRRRWKTAAKKGRRTLAQAKTLTAGGRA